MKRYIIFDLEWNQAGKAGELKDMPFEIIEIGAVMLDENKSEISSFSRLIKPKEYLVMHHMNQEISHISMDLTELQKNIRHFGLSPLSDGPIPYLDIQKLFSISKNEPKHRVSLEFAVSSLSIEKTRPFHRASNDVYYTSMVFKNIANEAL